MDLETSFADFPIVLGHSEKKGREVIASRSLKTGDLVIRVKSVSQVLHEEFLQQYCSNCFIPVVDQKDIKSCDKCRKISYCKNCLKVQSMESLFTRQLDGNIFSCHKDSGECVFNSQFLASKSKPSTELIFSLSSYLRFLIRLFYFKAYPPTTQQSSNNTHTTKPKGNIKTDSFVQDTWQDVMSLQSNSTDEQLQEEAKQVATVFMQYCRDLLPKSESIDMQEAQQAIMAVFINGHDIMSPGLNQQIGIGLHPAGALLNHSCAPNVAFYHDNTGMLCFRCIKDVKEGTELASTYIDIYEPSTKRKQLLKRRYNFDCECERCSNPVDDKLLCGFICAEKGCGKLLDETSEGSLHCSQCNKDVTVKSKQDILDSVIENQQQAIQLANMGQNSQALTYLLKSITFGTVHLHSLHSINFATYQVASVIFSSLKKFDQSRKFTEKQIDSLKTLFEQQPPPPKTDLAAGSSALPHLATKQKTLAMYLQDAAKSEADKNSVKQMNELLDKSFTAFTLAWCYYRTFMGNDHWYVVTLHQVTLLFDGKISSVKYIDLI